MLTLDEKSSAPLYVQIYRKLRDEILAGTLTARQPLKPIRAMADELGVSINTVKRAYNQLVVEGFVENMARVGYRVVDLSLLAPRKLKGIQPTAAKKAVRTQTEKPPTYDFTFSRLPVALFPFAAWKKYTSEALHGLDQSKLCDYNEHKGEYDFRKEIQQYLQTSRNVHCDVEQIIVCNGIQDSVTRLAQILTPDTVGLERPSLSLWGQIFRAHGFRTLPLSTFPKSTYLEELLGSTVKIAVTTPSHQFPVGNMLSMTDRLQLIQWAVEHDGLIIEDDYDCEFRYNSQPISAMQSIDTYGRIIYIGTFSKILAPGLRLNYMVLPKQLLPAYDTILGSQPTSVSWLNQKIMYHFMKEGGFQKHIRKIRTIYKEKYNVMVSACRDIFGEKAIIYGSDAGLHILLQVNTHVSQDDMVAIALEQDVRVYPTREYWDNVDYPNGLFLLGFSVIDKEDIVPGLRQLKQAWEPYIV